MFMSELHNDVAGTSGWQSAADASRLAAVGSGGCRTAMSCVSICIGIAMLGPVSEARAEGAFKRLSAAEIKKGLIGKVVTDGAHWSDRFKTNGALESIMHGQIQKGRWRLRGNDLCVTYSIRKENAEECYQVWRRQQVIEYRRDDVTIADGQMLDR